MSISGPGGYTVSHIRVAPANTAVWPSPHLRPARVAGVKWTMDNVSDEPLNLNQVMHG